MIRAIIFDCFGVIASSPWGEFLHSLPAELVEPARALNYQVDAGQITQKTYYRSIAELTGKDSPSIERIFGVDREKNLKLLKYIAELRRREYKIGLLSNISSHWITETLLTPQEVDLFDDILLSIDVHIVKPNPEIFHLAAERLGEESKRCVLVDDGPTNCDGARSDGMQAVTYRSFEQMRIELEKLL